MLASCFSLVDPLSQKFVSRKARKFQQQGGRLALPALEIGYFFLCINHAPRAVIVSKILPLVDELLATLKAHNADPSRYGVTGAAEYWDDLCLANFLRGLCLRFIAYPDPDAVPDPTETLAISQAEAEKGALEALQAVFDTGPKVVYDHHLVYYARECARCAGRDAER